ncbi:4-hydroxybenzoate polyprenyltransferase [Pseudarcicella hirudinis]|uniref:4-hydroxybenzoate polyprenyltransferase n=1 Tax=Pseudarcicella hirudinis TaxID=1079859 RepID=A0A1I5WZ55_9BACT|nr:geranylgeranylglycerol-phosphate geranylgeranyltransferase [Pseudarcicella hirudinis]SFQ24989.1 4-hydroxybenzoate polyprenyltransferase [Pseudarcicella hirudinis]
MARKVTIRQATLGFLRLIRTQNLLIIIFTQYFTRTFLIGSPSKWIEYLREKDLALICLSTVLIAAAGYIINDYYDIKIDLINKPDRVVIGRLIKRRWAMVINQSFNVLGILIGLLVSRKVFAVNLFAVFCLWIYSNQLKRTAFWGNLTVAIMTGLSLLVLAAFYSGHQKEVWIYAIFSFCITLIREIIKDMEDVKGDAAHGCKTLPILWGIARTKWLLYIFIASFLTILFAFTTQLPNSQIGYIFLIGLLPIGYLTYKLVLADTKKDFAFLSNFCKVIMLLGVLSMGFAN